MTRDITLNERSKKLINDLSQLIGGETLPVWTDKNVGTVDRKALVDWLKNDIVTDKQSTFLLASFRASLLENLHASFQTSAETGDKEEKEASWYAKMLFVWLVFSGTVLAACEGFDGIASVLGMFAAVPAAIIVTAGIAFAALAIIVFYSFDLVNISKNLGIKITKSPQFIDVLLEQINHIDVIKQEIDDCYTKTNSIDGLNELKEMAVMLKHRFDAMDDARKLYSSALNNTFLKVAKSATALFSGVLFLTGGFFAGQTLAVAVAGLFMTSVSLTILPVLIPSLITSVAAFSIYWYVERPGVENLVSSFFGFDKDNIKKLCDLQGGKNLDSLVGKIQARIDDQEKIRALQQPSTEYLAYSTAPNTVRFFKPQPESIYSGLDDGYRDLSAKLVF